MTAMQGIVLSLSLLAIAGMADCGAQAHRVERFSGMASFYGADYRGPTADGQRYDPRKFTAAHRTLPFGTVLRVTDPHNGRCVTVVVNDRGPFVDNRVLDLSMAAAKALRIVDKGVAKVTAVVKK